MASLLITIIVLAIVAGLLYWLVGLLPIPEPFGTIIKVCAILLCIVVLLGIVFGGLELPVLRVK